MVYNVAINPVIQEIYKRLIIPFYIPALMLVSLLLIINSKEKINYSKLRLVIFLLGFFIIIFSESTLRFINTSFYNNLIITLIPIVVILFLYLNFLSKFNFNKQIK